MVRRFVSVIVALLGVLLLASCSLTPFSAPSHGKSDTQLSLDRLGHIVDALNAHDAAALKSMFTEHARTEYSAEIDDGLTYLLSLFPDGGVVPVDPKYAPSVSGNVTDAGRATLVSSGYTVSSGGKKYSLFFADFTVNQIDPLNVGLYVLGAALETESGHSGAEMAMNSWGQRVDVDASGPPGVFVADNGQLSRDRMGQIVDALNAHNAAALKGMFTPYARTKYSAQIDKGLDYLLSQFPNGGITWQPEQGGSAVYERDVDGKKTVLLPTFYTVSSGGKDFRFFFADFTENTIDPDNLGIYAIGAVPAAEIWLDEPEKEIYTWSSSFDLEASTPPAVFIPKS